MYYTKDLIGLMIRLRMTFETGRLRYAIKLANGSRLHVKETVKIEPHIKRRLKNINSTLSFKWDKIDSCWNVVHKRIGDMPYIVMKVDVKRIDDKVFDEIEKSMWWSARGIKYGMNKMLARYNDYQDKLSERQTDMSREYAKRLSPLVATMADAKGSSHGNSRWLFHGMGESRMNANVKNL